MPPMPRPARALIKRIEAGQDAFPEDVREETRVLDALQRHPRKIMDLPNVLGVGFGFLPGEDAITAAPSPTVYVTKKVPLANLPPKARIPDRIAIGKRRMPIRVVPIGGVEPLCNPGDRTQQRAAHNPYEPGCVIADLVPPANVAAQIGTGGCGVRKAGDPTAPVYLLTCAHVIPPNHNVGHPRNAVIGTWLATAGGGLDACICEIQAMDPRIVCLGHPNQAMRPPLGAIVKKSGAGTGVTVSRVVQVARMAGMAGTIVTIENSKPMLPPATAPNPVPYLAPSDSGSVSLLGLPWFDLGPATDAKIQAAIAGLPQAAASQLLWTLRARFFNAAVCLNFGQSALLAPNGLPVFGFGHLMPEVLAAFQPPLEIVA